MKKLWSKLGLGALALMLALAFAACEGPTGPAGPQGYGAAMSAGTWSAASGSYHGPTFTVSVQVDAQRIINITHNAEAPLHHTASIGVTALDVLTERVLRHQTVEVDVVGGATISSVHFLQAVRNALVQAGAPPRLLLPTPRSRQIIFADVLVVGSGLAGASAALTARLENPNARVFLIELMERPGGTSRFTAEVITFPVDATDNQAFADYLMMRSQNQADSTIVERWAEMAATAFAFINNGTFSDTGFAPSGTATEPRMRFLFGGGLATGPNQGPGLAFNRAVSEGVIFWASTEATELLYTTTGNIRTVTGARARHHDYAMDITFSLNPGGSIILATGGFDNNATLMLQHNRLSALDLGHGIPGCGTGIEMAMAIGADAIFKGGIIGMIARDNRALFAQGVGMAGPFGNVPVLISQEGDVFRGSGGNAVTTFPIGEPINEGMFDIAPGPNLNNWTPHRTLTPVTFAGAPGDYPIAHRWMLEQRWAHGQANNFTLYDPNFAFWVPSRPAAAAAAPTATEIARQWVLEVPHTNNMEASLAALAGLVQMNPEALIAAWNDSGVATDGELRWRLTRHVPSSMGSMGGLMIDTQARVLRTVNGVTNYIVGLYAAGDVANGQVYYLEYPGSGLGLSLGLTFGYIAGRHAAGRLPTATP